MLFKTVLNWTNIVQELCEELCESRGGRPGHTPSIAFWHLPPNSARFSYATEGRGTLYFRAAVHRGSQRPPKGSGTDKTVEETIAQART